VERGDLLGRQPMRIVPNRLRLLWERLQCRVFGHAWEPAFAILEENDRDSGVQLRFVCARCGVQHDKAKWPPTAV